MKSRSRVAPIAVQARLGGTIVMMCDSNRIMILQILCVVSNDEIVVKEHNLCLLILMWVHTFQKR